MLSKIKNKECDQPLQRACVVCTVSRERVLPHNDPAANSELLLHVSITAVENLEFMGKCYLRSEWASISQPGASMLVDRRID